MLSPFALTKLVEIAPLLKVFFYEYFMKFRVYVKGVGFGFGLDFRDYI